ncbi:MAG: Nif11-like leader peptide family RiPP precursor [Xenococcaceae cyanobacterium MO_188.B19]|nr:Nif11-like leader peptide family RiPP precursor [Xenococcaceae cyanobacterium MO_188.B19]
MTIEAVNQFLTKVGEDQQLQAELAQVMEAENDCQAATELAAKYGYDFTPEELASEIEKRQNEFQNNDTSDELSEEELESVAGGACTPAVLLGPSFNATIKMTPKGKW